MWEPVGPLPAAVYWRRRGVAAAAVLALALALIWALSATTGTREESARTTRAALANPQQAVATADGAADSLASGAVGAADDGATSLQGTPDDVAITSAEVPTSTAALRALADGPSSAAPSTAETPTTVAAAEQLQPDLTPRPAPVATPVAVPPTGPVPCTNAMTGVTAEIDRPIHKVGEHPVLRLVLTNTSAQPCVRDLDPSRQEIVVWSGDGKTRVWSSNDCGNAGHTDLRTLIPGQPVAFTVTWAGRTSSPGCAQARTVVPAGSYRVMSRLDDDISAPTPFQLSA